MSISAAQGPQDQNPIVAKGQIPSESKIWKIIKNIFAFSALTGVAAGGIAGLHIRIGEAALLVLVPGSGYALSFIPTKRVKDILINKAKEVVKTQGENVGAAVEEGAKEAVGKNRDALGKTTGQVLKNAVTLGAHKVSQSITAEGKAAKEPILKDSPKPLNRQEAIAWIDRVVDSKSYPALNHFFKEASDHCYSPPKVAVNLDEDGCYQVAMDINKWGVNDPAYQLLLDLDAGIIDPAAFMAVKDARHELLQELIQYKSDHFFEEQSYQLGQLVDAETYPNLNGILMAHISLAKTAHDENASIFAVIAQLANGNRKGAEVFGINRAPIINEELEAFITDITEKEKTNLLHGVDLNMSVAKDVASLGAELAKGAVHTQINESYTALSKQIDTLVDPEKYPDLYAFLHLSNDTIHKNAAKELEKVVKNEDNLFFTLLDDLKEGSGVKHLEGLISMEKLPAEVLKDIMALGIEVGGNAAEETIKGCITNQIKSLYAKGRDEWTTHQAEAMGEKAGALIQKLKEKAIKAVRNEHRKPGFYDRTMTSWTMSGPWGSGAHLAFAKPESGVDVLVRLGAAMVGDGGLVSSAATELISNLIPEGAKNSTVSKKIAEGLQKVAEPARATSEWVDETLGMTDENKGIFLQTAATIALSGEGIMGNYGTAVAVPAIGAVLDHFGIADKKHFGEADSFFTEETAIRIGTGVVTTGLVEAYVRPTLGDEAASFTYVVSNLATTMAIPAMKESAAWKGVKDIAREGSASVLDFVNPEADEPVSSDPWASYIEDATWEAPKQAEEKPSLVSRFWGWVTEAPESEEDLWL